MAKRKKPFGPLKVGITGGIGSGKSTVCRIFEWFGVPVYYSDQRAIHVINTDKNVRSAIKNLLGSESYFKNNYNRKYVAKRVFKDQSLLKSLNQIVHPAVKNDFEIWAKNYSSSKYILKEAAILFESGAYKQVDKIICVTAPIELRIERILKRDALKKKDILARINNQMSEEERIKRSDYLITNDETQLLVPQVANCHKLISQFAVKRKKSKF